MPKISRRLGAAALASAFLVGACSTGSTPSPSPAASPAVSAAASTAASAATSPAASAATSPAASAPASAGAIACATGSITASGSTALQPLVDAAGKQYVAACSGATVSVQGGGSGTGLTQVSQGAVQIGDSDIFATDKLSATDAAALVDHQVVVQGFVMVANPSVTGVTNLTTAQAKSIWTGQITNWKDVGGPDQPIVLILRPASSGTRATFKKIVLGGANEATGQALTQDSNGAVTQAVQQTAGSTSYIGFAYYQANKAGLVAFQLDGVDATLADLSNGTYKLQAFGHMYTKGQPDGLTKSFLDYMMSPAVQQTLAPSLFYAPIPK